MSKGNINCPGCGRIGKKFFEKSGGSEIRYCMNRSCQTAHWYPHTPSHQVWNKRPYVPQEDELGELIPANDSVQPEKTRK